MAGIGDYEEGKPFSLKSGNTTSFKEMGGSPADFNLGNVFKKVHGALTGTEGKSFKDTKFGQGFNRAKDQVQSNANDDVKGNLFEGVGKAALNTGDESAGLDETTETTETGETPTSTLNEQQMESGNLNDFYKGGGGKLPSIQERAETYTAMGGEGNYRGTSEQNSQLLEHLKTNPQ